MKQLINGINLYYEEHGAGTPILFMHGYPLNHTIWNPLVPLLARHARLILPDLRGHGQTESPDGAYAMTTIAEDMRDLLDTLGLEQAILVGHSMGGYAALAFAQNYAQRLAGLALVATQSAADKPERIAGRYAAIEEVKKIGTVYLANTMPGQLTDRPELEPVLREIILATSPAGVVGSLLGMIARADMTAYLSQITAPCVVIAGEVDKLIPLEKSEEMATLLPHGRLVRVPGAGHLPMMEAPERVAEAILGLLSQD